MLLLLLLFPVTADAQPPQCGQPLLRPVRLAVHIRAGDAENDGRRLLPHAYFFEIIRTLTKVRERSPHVAVRKAAGLCRQPCSCKTARHGS